MIKNIIFDLGGVLLNIEYKRTVEAFRALGLKNPEAQFTKEVQSELFQKYERGHISDKQFLEALAVYMPKARQDEIEAAWCALLGDFPLRRLQVLERLSEKYRLLILSNTNHIHQLKFEKIIEDTCGWERFASHFDFIGYSHQMHERKPDEAIFSKILNMNELEAGDSFFIDDTEEHVLSARRSGMAAHHLKTNEKIEDFFKTW
jgi:putative hydrolase of the HAD superfamily